MALPILLFYLLTHVLLPLVTQAEVDQHDIEALLGDHQKILRFEVAVCNLMRVTIFNDADHLSEEHPGIVFSEISFFLEPAEEFSAVAVAT